MHPARNVTMTSAPSGSTDEGERGIVLLLDSNGLICVDCWGWHMVSAVGRIELDSRLIEKC